MISMEWEKAGELLGIPDLKERMGNKNFSSFAALREIAGKKEISMEDVEQIARTCFLPLPSGENQSFFPNRFFCVWSLDTIKEEFTDSPENRPPFYRDKEGQWHGTFEKAETQKTSPLSLLKEPRKWAESNGIKPGIPHFMVGKERAGNFYDRNEIIRTALKSRRLRKFVKDRLFPVCLFCTHPDSEKLLQDCFQSVGIEIFYDREDSHGFIWYEDYASLPMLNFSTPDGKMVRIPKYNLLKAGNWEDRIRFYSQSSFHRAGERAFRQLESQYQSLKDWDKNLEEQFDDEDPTSEGYKKLRSLFGFSARIDGAQNREMLYQLSDILKPGGSGCYRKEIEYLDLEMGLIARKKAYIQQLLQLQYLLQFRIKEYPLHRPSGQPSLIGLSIPFITVDMKSGKILIQECIEIPAP